MNSAVPKHGFETMVKISAGEFIFGHKFKIEFVDSLPESSTHLEEYWIDRTPVTFQQYQEFVKDTEYLPPIRDRRRAWERPYYKYLWRQNSTYNSLFMDMPMIFLTWFDALAYSEWAGKCLPTELEWEKAARGQDGRTYPWGYDQECEKYCNCTSQCEPNVHPDLTSVFAYPQGISPYGCLDMLGNCNEWCWDYFREPVMTISDEFRFDFKRIPSKEISHDGSSDQTPYRTTRGSGRTAFSKPIFSRNPTVPTTCSPYIGFRCVWHPTTPLKSRWNR